MALTVTFLGQAGVLLDADGERLLVDPYLSDNLNLLSQGFWARAYDIPLDPNDLIGVHGVVCTHEHQDHLDPLTIAPLLAGDRRTKLLAPQAALPTLAFRAREEQLVGMRGENDVTELGPFRVRSIPAAHTKDYQLEHDPAYGYRWNSVVIEVDGKTVFHAGDTVDWDGYAEAIGPVDVACVPINGRGREDQDIVGNLEAEEAADLARRVFARHVLAIHWDMFAVNPGDPEAFKKLFDGEDRQVWNGPAMSAFTIA